MTCKNIRVPFTNPRRRRGLWKLNVTNLGDGAINPRKGDSSCYPRVMPKAYPWLKLLSPRLNPESGLHCYCRTYIPRAHLRRSR